MSRRSNNSSPGSTSRNNEAHSTWHITCRCGFELPVITSWSSDNPGRRYRACPNYGKVGYCGGYIWLDPEICDRSKRNIPGLLRRLNNLEDEVASYKEKGAEVERAKKAIQEKMSNLQEKEAEVEGERKLIQEWCNSLQEKEAEIGRERRSIEKKTKKLEKLIAMYNGRMKMQVVVFALIAVCIALFVMMMTMGRGKLHIRNLSPKSDLSRIL